MLMVSGLCWRSCWRKSNRKEGFFTAFRMTKKKEEEIKIVEGKA
ncbi:MAG: hypothetical protein ABR936_15985 [Bacteroidota bacterium]